MQLVTGILLTPSPKTLDVLDICCGCKNGHLCVNRNTVYGYQHQAYHVVIVKKNFSCLNIFVIMLYYSCHYEIAVIYLCAPLLSIVRGNGTESFKLNFGFWLSSCIWSSALRGSVLGRGRIFQSNFDKVGWAGLLLCPSGCVIGGFGWVGGDCVVGIGGQVNGWDTATSWCH